MRVAFIFLDGVGVGDADAAGNPFHAARLPVLRELLGGTLPAGTAGHGAARATLRPLDASLGVPGTPQSGTGQAALLTGRNAARLHGRHFGPWVPTTLRELVRATSILARARAAGRSAAFANAYPEELFTPEVAARPPRFLRAGPPLAALGAGLLVHHTAALRDGRALASEIVNDGWRERLGRTGLPVVTPGRAGANLAAIVAQHELTLFAHYTTDAAGHERDLDAGIAALERVDAFLGGLLPALPEDALLVIASDHGNIEDVTRGHTLNPALCIVAGPDHALRAAGLRDITDVAPMVLAALGID